MTNDWKNTWEEAPVYFTDKHAASMTLRDHFAGLALQGLLANPKLRDEILKHGDAFGGWIEKSAYSWADAMLVAREEKL
jgi:hypothetical protein